MPSSVFVVPILDRWLLHAPLHRVAALINWAAARECAREGGPTGLGLSGQLAEALSGEAPLVPRPREGPVRPQFLGLIPTRACNAACVYCGFGSVRQADVMDPKLAAAAVDWMAEHAVRCGRQSLDIHFFGGEPLIAGDVVDVAVHRTRAVAAEQGLTPHLEVATNGVYGEERARFVGDYFDTVVLSFDGFASIQNRHRPLTRGRASFEYVAATARVLSTSSTELCLRLCVADDNVDQLLEIVDWFCEEFRPAGIDFEGLQPTPESERAGLFAPDPYEFTVRFWRARQVVLERGVKPIYAAAIVEEPRITFCPVGNDTLILHPDGRVSACYLQEKDWRARGLDLYLGRLAEGTMDLDACAIERVRHLVADKPRCAECFCRWSCAGGCHVNHSFAGCPRTYDDFCLQTRLITACTLLEALDQGELAERLMSDRASMERLALWPSDRLEHWEDTHD